MVFCDLPISVFKIVPEPVFSLFALLRSSLLFRSKRTDEHHSNCCNNLVTSANFSLLLFIVTINFPLLLFIVTINLKCL